MASLQKGDAATAEATLAAISQLLQLQDGAVSSGKNGAAVVNAVKRLMQTSQRRDAVARFTRAMVGYRDLPSVVALALRGAEEVLQTPQGSCKLYLVSPMPQ
jgi:hypothetical protein